MKRLLEPDEPIQPGDEMWNAMKGKFEPVFSKLDKACNGAVIVREVPDRKWRAINDGGQITYPCWVANGNEVTVATGHYADGTPSSVNRTAAWDAKISHWMPKEIDPKPPEVEKPAEQIAFEKWVQSKDYDSTWTRQAWLAAIEFMKEQMVKRADENLH